MKQAARLFYYLAAFVCMSDFAHAQQTAATPQQQVQQQPQPGADFQNNIDVQKFSAAKELIGLMDMKATFQSSFTILAKALMPIITRANPHMTVEMQKIIIDTVSNVFLSHMDEMSNNAAMVYASVYTYDELGQIIAFYKTPVGQKMLKSQAETMQKTMALNQSLNMQVTKECMAAIVAELKKRGMNVPKEMGI